MRWGEGCAEKVGGKEKFVLRGRMHRGEGCAEKVGGKEKFVLRGRMR